MEEMRVTDQPFRDIIRERYGPVSAPLVDEDIVTYETMGRILSEALGLIARRSRDLNYIASTGLKVAEMAPYIQDMLGDLLDSQEAVNIVMEQIRQ